MTGSSYSMMILVITLKISTPLAPDVGDMVKCLSIIIADLRRPKPLRHGSSSRDGQQRTEQQRIELSPPAEAGGIKVP